MNMRDDDSVSAVALVVEDSSDEPAEENGGPPLVDDEADPVADGTSAAAEGVVEAGTDTGETEGIDVDADGEDPGADD